MNAEKRRFCARWNTEHTEQTGRFPEKNSIFSPRISVGYSVRLCVTTYWQSLHKLLYDKVPFAQPYTSGHACHYRHYLKYERREKIDFCASWAYTQGHETHTILAAYAEPEARPRHLSCALVLAHKGRAESTGQRAR
jgi:hypothetical protein